MTARNYCDKPLTIVVPQVAGSLNDKFTRAFASELGAVLGQTVNVENRAGAQGVAGSEYVAREAPADGGTLVMTSINNLASFAIFGQAERLDPLRELTPVIVFAESRLLLGSAPSQPWRTFADLVAYARAYPAGLRYGASSSSNRLSTEIILRELGLSMSYVPFDSTAVYQQAIAAGDPHIGLMPELAARGWGETIRYLAQTGQQRSASFPDVPTFAELGLPQIKGVKYAFCVRAGTSHPNLQRLNDAVTQAVTPRVKTEFGKFLMELRTQTLAEARETLVEHVRAVTEIASRIGVKQ